MSPDPTSPPSESSATWPAVKIRSPTLAACDPLPSPGRPPVALCTPRTVSSSLRISSCLPSPPAVGRNSPRRPRERRRPPLPHRGYATWPAVRGYAAGPAAAARRRGASPGEQALQLAQFSPRRLHFVQDRLQQALRQRALANQIARLDLLDPLGGNRTGPAVGARDRAGDRR